MAGPLPERAVEQLGRLHLQISRLFQAPAHVAFEHAVERPAVRVPEDAADCLFPAGGRGPSPCRCGDVALLRLLELVEMRLESVLARPGRAVDPLQPRILGVARQ